MIQGYPQEDYVT